jgi:uncharacterized membrane protein
VLRSNRSGNERMREMTRSQRLLAGFFTFAGTMHFLRRPEYEAIVPPGLPAREAVAISGVAEIAGGLAVISPATRRLAGWWLVALLIAVFPANVYMTLHPEQVAKRGGVADEIPIALLWARLPLQPMMIWWAWRATRQVRGRR